jgi:hypothetical protein
MEAFKKSKPSSTHSNKSDGKTPFLGIQAKLQVNKPGDKYEVEADRAADRVVSKQSVSTPAFVASTSSVQLKQNDQQSVIQEKPIVAGITPVVMRMNDETLQTSSNTTSKNANANGLSTQLGNSKGSGSKLPEGVKSEMESSFGTDFSGVNIHTSESAVQMNEQLQAKAFTHGNDIYFNNGNFQPQSTEGKHLLAHELTHTIQQGGNKQVIQRASKKLNDHENGFLNVKNESSKDVYPLSYNAEVDYTKQEGGREYFTANEWPHQNEKSSVKGSGRFVTGKYDPAASVDFYKSKMKLVFGNGIVVKAHSMDSDPVANGTHELMLPDYPHTYGYLEDSVFSYAWFRIGEGNTKYLHIGNITAGCVTVGASETGAPEDRKKWTAIYKYLINSRAGNNRSVGKIKVHS